MSKTLTNTPNEFPRPKALNTEQADAMVPRRVGKYDTIVETLSSMRVADAAYWSFNRNVDVRRVIRNLVMAMHSAGVKAPKGHAFYKYVTPENELLVRVLPRKAHTSKKSGK